MLKWLFGRKKKNAYNEQNVRFIKNEIAVMSQQKRVQTLRRLISKHEYNPDYDYLFGDDLMWDVLMLYILMEMTDVVSDEADGLYMEESITETVEQFETITEDSSIEEPTPTPVDVEERVIEHSPVEVEQTVTSESSFEDRASKMGESFDTPDIDRSSSFGDSYGSDSGSSYDSGSDCSFD